MTANTSLYIDIKEMRDHELRVRTYDNAEEQLSRKVYRDLYMNTFIMSGYRISGRIKRHVKSELKRRLKDEEN